MRPLILLLTFANVFLACADREDTCHPLGHTFMSVELDPTTAAASLSLSLVTLDTLPEAYYAKATLVRLSGDQNGNAFNNLADGSFINLPTADRLIIDLPTPADTTEDAGISISYPDRQDFVDCKHPGSGDEYVLFIFFTYLPDGQVENFRWVEDFRPGGF